jgi:hypothetical protein
MNKPLRNVIEVCPVCGDHLVVTQLKCGSCETEIHGAFRNSVFCRLSAEDQAFAEMFIRLRGNVKEMERELGVAYNAVRNRLDQVIQNLGLDSAPPQPPLTQSNGDEVNRRAILDQLEQGEISADEAVDLLSGSPTKEEDQDE